MVLVTGGAGFIGSYLVARLVRDGRPVRVLDDFSSGKRERLAAYRSEVDLVEGDLRDRSAVERAVQGVDVVFHLAAEPSVSRSIADPQTTVDINVTGTLNLLQAATGAGCRKLVFASTCAVYGDDAPAPTPETALPRPLSPYAMSKLAGEHLCAIFARLHGLDTVSLRYFNVFGPGQDPASAYAAAIPRFVAALASGASPVIYGDGAQTRDFVSVDDVVSANLLAASANGAAGGVFNVGTGQATTIGTVVAELQRLMRTRVEVRHELARPGDIRHSVADIGETRAVLGYEPGVSFSEGLERLVKGLA